MKLISMVDFVLEQRKNKKKDNIRRFWACERYAKFLKQPLTLGMFVPVDEDGKPLEEPEPYEVRIGFDESDIEWNKEELEEYIKANEKVLFEGFSFDGNVAKTPNGQYLNHSKLLNLNIEDIVKEDLTLTPNAIKQLGL